MIILPVSNDREFLFVKNATKFVKSAIFIDLNITVC